MTPIRIKISLDQMKYVVKLIYKYIGCFKISKNARNRAKSMLNSTFLFHYIQNKFLFNLCQPTFTIYARSSPVRQVYVNNLKKTNDCQTEVRNSRCHLRIQLSRLRQNDRKFQQSDNG